MTNANQAAILQRLARLVAAVPAAPAALAAGHIDVVRKLAAAAAVLPSEEPAAVPREMVDALCRKIHVARVVCAEYGPGWKRLAGAAPLAEPGPALATALLLAWAYASHATTAATATADDAADRRGVGLKCLNAALAALDLARAAGNCDVELQTLADTALSDLTGTAPAPEAE